MSTLDHIADLRAQAEAAVAEAATTERLEELRVQWLGRRAELPNLLRTVAELPPEERGAVGRAANEARQAITRSIEETQARLAEAELEQRLERDRVDVTLPGTPPQPVGRLHLLTADAAGDRGRLPRPGLPGARGAGGRDASTTTSTR